MLYNYVSIHVVQSSCAVGHDVIVCEALCTSTSLCTFLHVHALSPEGLPVSFPETDSGLESDPDNATYIIIVWCMLDRDTKS